MGPWSCKTPSWAWETDVDIGCCFCSICKLRWLIVYSTLLVTCRIPTFFGLLCAPPGPGVSLVEVTPLGKFSADVCEKDWEEIDVVLMSPLGACLEKFLPASELGKETAGKPPAIVMENKLRISIRIPTLSFLKIWLDDYTKRWVACEGEKVSLGCIYGNGQHICTSLLPNTGSATE